MQTPVYSLWKHQLIKDFFYTERPFQLLNTFYFSSIVGVFLYLNNAADLDRLARLHVRQKLLRIEALSQK